MKSLVLRRMMGALAALVLGSAVTSACSAPIECKPPLPAGTVYRVTLLAETTTSDACHVVNGKMMSPFYLTVGKAEATNTDPACNTSPAAGAPSQTDVAIQSCLPSDVDMLGVYCQIKYKSTCEGAINFYFANPAGGSVNWEAPVIDGALFRIEDHATSCLPDIANCTDEYTARLERMN